MRGCPYLIDERPNHDLRPVWILREILPHDDANVAETTENRGGLSGSPSPPLCNWIRTSKENERMPSAVTDQPNRDHWAEWVLHRRHGGADDELRATLNRLSKIRERVLDNAEVAAGLTLLDVGTGDGLIAFGALERVG
jgi:hypothetical protein